jgi:hypothetical protein
MFDIFGCYAFHEQQKMDIINYLAAAADPNDEETQRQAFARARANPRNFTQADFREIERKVMRRRNR